MVMERGCAAEMDPAAVTVTEMPAVPAEVGIPEMTPVEVLRLSPMLASEPLPETGVAAHATPALQLVQDSVWLYATPTVPPEIEVVVMTGVGPAETVTESCCAVEATPPTVTVTEKLTAGATVVGVPERAPVVGLSEAQDGSEPLETAKVGVPVCVPALY